MTDIEITHLGSFTVKKGEKSIFLVTVLSSLKNIRCWGWYSDLEQAKADVLSNATDMFECGYYKYAVIERVPEGICQVVEDAWWFYADYDGNIAFNMVPPVVRAIEKPEQFESVCNFGIG